jgi:hypothetical protein
MLEDFLVNLLIWLQRAALWLLIAGPYVLGIVAGLAVRLWRLWRAAVVEGYQTGVGNA